MGLSTPKHRDLCPLPTHSHHITCVSLYRENSGLRRNPLNFSLLSPYLIHADWPHPCVWIYHFTPWLFFFFMRCFSSAPVTGKIKNLYFPSSLFLEKVVCPWGLQFPHCPQNLQILPGDCTMVDCYAIQSRSINVFMPPNLMVTFLCVCFLTWLFCNIDTVHYTSSLKFSSPLVSVIPNFFCFLAVSLTLLILFTEP